MGVRLLTPMCAMVLRSPLVALRTWPLPLWCSAMRSMASAPPSELLPLRIPPSPRPSSSQGSRAATQHHQRISSPYFPLCVFVSLRSTSLLLCVFSVCCLCMAGLAGSPADSPTRVLYDSGLGVNETPSFAGSVEASWRCARCAAMSTGVCGTRSLLGDG